MKTQNRGKWIILTAVSVVLITTIVVSTGLTSTFMDSYNSLKIFSEVLKEVLENYVVEMDADSLVDGAIRGMLSELDPHTVYLPKDSFKELKISTRGNFGGLGIQISVRDGWLTVISPIEGTPADRVGIRPGDKIIKIEGESTKGITIEEAVSKLRGQRGTDVHITVFRKNIDEPIDFTITRDIIEIKSVPYYGVLPSGNGYIRLADFSEGAGRQIAEKIRELNKQQIKGLIFDLRSNTGGLLPEAIDVSDCFIPKGKLVVSTKGRHVQDDKEYFARTDPVMGNYPLIVLVNGGTASASEIVSGAIQDWDRGLIMGTVTYGKGSVQTIRQLDENSAIKLTTAYYYTPSGRCIHKSDKKGEPGLKVAGGGVAESGETGKQPKREIFHTASGRNVFGGGGITPDIRFEGQPMTRLMMDILRKSCFFNFSVSYSSKRDSSSIPGDFIFPPEEMASFRKFLEESGISFTGEEFATDSLFISERLTSEIIGDVRGRTAAYKREVEMDPLVASADSILVVAGNTGELFRVAAEYNEKHETNSGSDSLSVSAN